MATATLHAEYLCTTPLNLYKTPELQGLVTQAAAGRHVRLFTLSFRTWG